MTASMARRALVAAVCMAVLCFTLAPSPLVPTLSASTPGTHAQAQPQSAAAAVQTVIQKSDQEQTQALASGDPTVMSDTATGGYYRQLSQINDALIIDGVTSIALSNLSWGPINVAGTTATAIDDETWLTTYSDGTTSESTNTNIYTLVQQSGMWLIQSDEQTAAQPAGSPTPAPTGVPVPASQNTSHNWSGYAATGGNFSGVSGTWTVPQPSSSATAGVGATWVGIGGVSSRDLIQAGTQDVTSGGQHQFQTWIEMLPAASQQVPLAVAPGDSVTVAILEQGAGSGVWQISLTNNTSKGTYRTTVSYNSSESSAEWIEEAPTGKSGILPLDNFGSVVFGDATAVENQQTVDLSQAGAQPITMVNTTKQALAVPSAITAGGFGFTVTRTSVPATDTGPSGAPRPRPGH